MPRASSGRPSRPSVRNAWRGAFGPRDLPAPQGCRMIAFRGAQKAWAGGASVGPLDLSIDEGRFVALIGGSGSGKTTTLKMVNRLVAP
ncbi:MAG: ATP-binding cassette domain-containing protein, partial [Caulobacteraceae bacterium]